MTDKITKAQFIARYDGTVDDKDKAQAEEIFSILDTHREGDGADVIDSADFKLAAKGNSLKRLWLETALRADLMLKPPESSVNTNSDAKQTTEFSSFWKVFRNAFEKEFELKTKSQAILYAIDAMEQKSSATDEKTFNARLAELKAGISAAFKIQSDDPTFLVRTCEKLTSALRHDFEHFSDEYKKKAEEAVVIALVDTMLATKKNMYQSLVESFKSVKMLTLQTTRAGEYEKVARKFLDLPDKYPGMMTMFTVYEVSVALIPIMNKYDDTFEDKTLMNSLRKLKKDCAKKLKDLLGAQKMVQLNVLLAAAYGEND